MRRPHGEALLGRRVNNRYEVKRLLGRGASKDVYLARDVRLDRDVALAVIERRGGEGLPPRVLEEIRTTARLDEHPHIVTVYDVIDEEDATWIVSQLVRHGSVGDLLREHPDGLPIDQAVDIARQVADALHFAHEHGVIHRDVKPANVLRAGPETVLLADFGVAFDSDRARLTATGAPIGTPAYMSPEQSQGESVDRRSDLYALGAMLFELTCGRPPFRADSVVATLMKHLSEPAPDATEINPRVPEALGRLIDQLLSKEPDDRPASGLVVRQALDALRVPTPAQAAGAAAKQPLPGPLAIDPRRPFVGRQGAMGELLGAWDRSASGPPQLAIVRGEAGIGKTALSAALARRLHEDGACVLYGRCDEDPLVSYQPLVEAIRQLITHQPSVVSDLGAGWATELTELSRLIPELRRHGMTPLVAAQRGESLDRFRLFEAMLQLLSVAVDRQGVLLVLDDMQWADEPTELLLRHIMRAQLGRLLVLVTRRPPELGKRDPLARVVADLEREVTEQPRLVALSLGGLDVEATHALASARRDHPIDREFSRRLRADTAGNPFFIEQVLRGLREADLTTDESAVSALRSLRLPQEVEDFIQYRISRFGAETRELLTQAAVCGPDFRLDALAVLRQISTDSVLRLLREPLVAGLILEPNIGRYTFSHALVRETLFERGLTMTERAHLSLRIGEALEQVLPAGGHAAELARHFHAAREVGGAEKAVTYALAAARDASEALAYEAAAMYTLNAADALKCLGAAHDSDRCRQMEAAGRLYWLAGDQRRAQANFWEAASLARELGDVGLFARAALGYAGRSYDAEGIDPKLRWLFEQALATVPESDRGLRAKLMARFAEALHPVEGERALELTEEATDILRRAPSDDSLTTTLAARHMALLHINHAEERMEVCQRWVEIADRRGHQSIGFALNWLLYDLLERGDAADLDAANGARSRLHQIADTLKQPLYRHFAACFDAKWMIMRGDFAAGEEKAGEAYEYGVRAQGTHVALLRAGELFLVRRDQGRIGQLLDEVSGFLETQHQTLPAWRAARVVARAESGDRELAAAELTELMRDGCAAIPRDMFWLGAVCLAAAGAAGLNDRAVASDLRDQLEPYVRYNAQIGLAGMLGPVHGFLGRLAALLDDHAAAARHYEDALQRCATLRALPAQARLQCEYGESLLSARRDGADARRLLEKSRATALELGMVEVARRAEQALKLNAPRTSSTESVAET